MTDTKEAQPEALPDLDIDTAGHSGIRIRGYSVERVKSLHAELQQIKAQLNDRGDYFYGWGSSLQVFGSHQSIKALKAQLSARQAAPLCYLHVAATIIPGSGYQVCSQTDAGAFPVYVATPRPPEREPLSHEAARKLVWSASTWSRSEGVSEDDVLEVIAAVERAQGIGATHG